MAFFLGGVDFKRMNGIGKKDLAPRNKIARNNDSVKRSTSMQIKQGIKILLINCNMIHKTQRL